MSDGDARADSRLTKLKAANIFDSHTDHAEHMIKSIEHAGLVLIDPDQLAVLLHRAMEWQYDQCDHGRYTGGPNAGNPYAMCEILARRVMETNRR